MATYEVTGPLALVKDQAGKVGYHYQGAIVPEGTPAEELNRPSARGLIGKVDQPIPVPTHVPPRTEAPEIEPAAGDGSDDGQPPASEPAAPVRPMQVATKAAWVDYAVARGLDRAEAEGMTKQQLMDALPAD